MRIGRPTTWERALELYDGAKQDLAIATGAGVFAGLATLDAHFSWFASGRQVATLLAMAVGSGAALLGIRAGARAIGAAAFAAVAGAQYVIGAQGDSAVAGAASAAPSSTDAREVKAP
jgi:hypothetical protein